MTIVAGRYPGPVSLAFLEGMQLDFQAACCSFVERGAERIIRVPVFPGTGGHILKDLFGLVESARKVTHWRAGHRCRG